MGKSFVYLNSSGNSFAIGQFYNLQRWMDVTGGGRGKYPIKFNGLLYTTDYFVDNVLRFNADYRAWGGPYWFQNTRFPYWAFLASGDYEMIQQLVDMYFNALPLAEARSKSWFGHIGAFFPETMFFWGTYITSDYGCDANKSPVWAVNSPWMRYHYNGGLELLALMITYYSHTQDQDWAKKYLLPLAESELNFYGHHYPTDLNGKICLTPAQSIETWQEAINPLPDVAGLTWITSELLKFSFISDAQKNYWSHIRDILPAIPQGTNQNNPVLIPAEVVLSNSLHNGENAELYAVFPFPIYGVNLPNLDIAVNTWKVRRFHSSNGWSQDLLDAALLGLTSDAATLLTQRVTAPLGEGFRFPTFTGPFHDYVPEEDHNSVAELGLQYMLLQARGNTIYIFPTWPAGWDVHFKLHTIAKTTVEAVCKGGKITSLIVTPESQRQNVKVAGTSCTL